MKKPAKKCADCFDTLENPRMTRCLNCLSRILRVAETGDWWEVDITVEIPVAEGQSDYDNAKHHLIECRTREQAVWFAKLWADRDVWGGAQITPFRREPFDPQYPRALHKVYTGDSFTL